MLDYIVWVIVILTVSIIAYLALRSYSISRRMTKVRFEFYDNIIRGKYSLSSKYIMSYIRSKEFVEWYFYDSERKFNYLTHKFGSDFNGDVDMVNIGLSECGTLLVHLDFIVPRKISMDEFSYYLLKSINRV